MCDEFNWIANERLRQHSVISFGFFGNHLLQGLKNEGSKVGIKWIITGGRLHGMDVEMNSSTGPYKHQFNVEQCGPEMIVWGFDLCA